MSDDRNGRIPHTHQDRHHDKRVTAAEGPNDIEEIVDDLEDKLVQERREEGVPGNVTERAATTPLDTGDEAPD